VKPRLTILCTLLSAMLVSTACMPDIDKYFVSKRLNRLAVARDDITPGKLVIFKSGVARTADHLLEVAKTAQLSVKGFNAVLPAEVQSKTIDASLALKVVDAVVPLGVDGALKLSGDIEVSQTEVVGSRIDATQIKDLLASQDGAPLRSWVLGYAKKQVQPFIILETYSAKKITLREKNGKDITVGLSEGATKIINSGEAKVKITRSKKEELVLEGDKYYVFAVNVAAFDLTQGATIGIGDLGVDLSLPTPKVPVLGSPAENAKLFRPVGLAPAFEQ
jgi:hypothetical protein